MLFDLLLITAKVGFVAALLVAMFVIIARIANSIKLTKFKKSVKAEKSRIIAFFHPFCDAMGGGEKVLYQALKALQQEPDFENDTIIIYSGAKSSPEQILSLAKEKFSTQVNLKRNNLQFVQLKSHDSMHADNYPSFTLLWQLIAYNKVCAEALNMAPCDIFVDTIGVGFAYPLVKILFGSKVVSYTHYPTISSDMLKQINTNQFNNQVAGSFLKRTFKRVYYSILMVLYAQCGRFADVIATNSSWTDRHIRALWGDSQKVVKIYPPCDTQDLVDSNPLKAKRANAVMSCAQFRPEKNHEQQLKIWKAALPKLPSDAVFYICGGVRGDADLALLNDLKKMAVDMNLKDSVKFVVSQPRDELLKIFAQAKVGLHTMKEEHFGIAIVEMMSAGLVTIAHASGGPLHDIIGKSEEHIGFLCKTTEEFAQQLVHAMKKFEEHEIADLRENARKHVNENFAVSSFDAKFVKMVRTVL